MSKVLETEVVDLTEAERDLVSLGLQLVALRAGSEALGLRSTATSEAEGAEFKEMAARAEALRELLADAKAVLLEIRPVRAGRL